MWVETLRYIIKSDRCGGVLIERRADGCQCYLQPGDDAAELFTVAEKPDTDMDVIASMYDPIMD